MTRGHHGFGYGKFNYLEVLDAQRTYFAAKSQYLKALAKPTARRRTWIADRRHPKPDHPAANKGMTMKFGTNKLNVGKKQWIAIAVIAVVGVGLGRQRHPRRQRQGRKEAEGEATTATLKPKATAMVSIMARQAMQHEDDRAMRMASTMKSRAKRAAWRQTVQ